MAVKESSEYKKITGDIQKPKSFLRNAANLGLNTLLSPLEGLTGKNFFNPDSDWETLMKVSDTSGAVVDMAGKIAANTILPGSGAVVDMVGKTAGSFIDAEPMPNQEIINSLGMAASPIVGNYAGPAKLATGGKTMKRNNKTNLITYKGKTHEQGGIIRGSDELEGGETEMPIDEGTGYVFSKMLMFNKKTSFADKSKEIEATYANRPHDPLAQQSKKQALMNLARAQELLREKMGLLDVENGIENDSNMFFGGGKRFLRSQFAGFPKMSSKPIPKVLDSPQTKIKTREVKPPTFNNNFKDSNIILGEADGLFKKDMLPEQLGYAAQALSVLPMLNQKPSDIKYPRLTAEEIKVNKEPLVRSARERNALAKKLSKQYGTGAAGIFSTLASQNAGDFANAYLQAETSEIAANASERARVNAANAEIGIREADAIAAEKDAVKSMKLQGFADLGSIAAASGRGQSQGMNEEMMMNILMGTNADYSPTIEDGDLVGFKRRAAYGGKRYKCGGTKRRK